MSILGLKLPVGRHSFVVIRKKQKWTGDPLLRMLNCLQS